MNPEIIDSTPSPRGAFPPLPDPLLPFADALFPQPPQNQARSLRCGCYLVNYQPNGNLLVMYDGSLRVECHNNGRTASGDLYQRPIIQLPPTGGVPAGPMLGAGPNPASGIPIHTRSRYRYYLRVTQLLESSTVSNTFTLGFEMHRFTKASGGWSTGGSWANEGTFTAQMTWQTAPSGFPSSGDYLAGDVKNSSGTVVGRLTMGWVSSYLRKATIEIDRVAQADGLLDNGAGVSWTTVGDEVGWQISVDVSETNIVEPSGESWSDGECHAEMLARRDSSDLDAEWRYHVLAVRRLDSTERGIMYDASGGDSNNIPREGAAISSHWTIPNGQEWGLVRGVRFGAATGPYFRTVVHETGHAMGLYHNTADLGFMNATNVIANSSLTPGSLPFPNNIQWSFNPEDAKRLRHMPDIYVRPGGVPFGTSYASTPISPADMVMDVVGVELRVKALMETVPLGAPVRVNIELVNTGSVPVLVPATLSMKSGLVKGTVADPTGTLRAFQPIVLCVEEIPLAILEPTKSITNSITLLRGAQGALFPIAGPHRIRIEVHWDAGTVEAEITGEVDVMVTPITNEAHAKAALKVLSTPDTLLSLAVEGDHLKEGNAAIQAALDSDVLRPHYAYVEAKRVAQRFGKRRANLRAASQLLDDTTVMSPAEIKKAAGLVKTDGADNASKSIASVLKHKVTTVEVSDEIKSMVDSL